MTARPVIALDCDGVLADFVGAVLLFLNTPKYNRSYHGRKVTHDDITGWGIFESAGYGSEVEREFVRYAERPVFNYGRALCAHFDALPYAADTYRKLADIADVVIVTASYKAIRGWETDRRYWLESNLGVDPNTVLFVPSCQKHRIRADILVDDSNANCREFQGEAVMPARPWNQPESGIARVHERSVVRAVEALLEL